MSSLLIFCKILIISRQSETLLNLNSRNYYLSQFKMKSFLYILSLIHSIPNFTFLFIIYISCIVIRNPLLFQHNICPKYFHFVCQFLKFWLSPITRENHFSSVLYSHENVRHNVEYCKFFPLFVHIHMTEYTTGV